MSTKIGLYFQLEMNDPRDTFPLMKLALKRLEKLENEGVNVEYLELRLTESHQGPTNKQASIKLDGDGRTFIDSEVSTHWDDAFTVTFDRIQNQFSSLKPQIKQKALEKLQDFNVVRVAG